MLTGEFVIIFEEGLHARPASELVKLCQQTTSVVRLIKDGHKIDPKSILGIMSLGAVKNDIIGVQIEGPDEQVTFAKIKEFFEVQK